MCIKGLRAKVIIKEDIANLEFFFVAVWALCGGRFRYACFNLLAVSLNRALF